MLFLTTCHLTFWPHLRLLTLNGYYIIFFGESKFVNNFGNLLSGKTDFRLWWSNDSVQIHVDDVTLCFSFLSSHYLCFFQFDEFFVTQPLCRHTILTLPICRHTIFTSPFWRHTIFVLPLCREVVTLSLTLPIWRHTCLTLPFYFLCFS